MTGFAIRANEPIFNDVGAQVSGVPEGIAAQVPHDVEWFRQELELRGVKGFELICGDYKENFHQIPPELMDRYLELRPLKLHRTALETVLKDRR